MNEFELRRKGNRGGIVFIDGSWEESMCLSLLSPI